MRSPFNITDIKTSDGARVKFLYSSPEFHQNIEMSIDGEEASVDMLLDVFERFLKSLGIEIPHGVALGFIQENNDDESEGGTETEEDL